MQLLYRFHAQIAEEIICQLWSKTTVKNKKKKRSKRQKNFADVNIRKIQKISKYPRLSRNIM